jgi:hypothetical protein
MSLPLETALVTTLQALCPRVYFDIAPVDVPQPYIVCHQIGGQAPMYQEGAVPARRNSNVQINVWGPSREVCNTLSLQVEQALVQHPTLQAQPLNALTALYDDDTATRGAMQDFSLWEARA